MPKSFAVKELRSPQTSRRCPIPLRSRPVVALTIGLATAILPTATWAQSGPLAGFEAYVEQAVEDWEVPGLAIAVVKDGQVVYSQAFGVRTLGESEPVTTQTLFAIGSTTKAMTAAAIGMLVDDGGLDWDDRVTDRLPGFELHDPYVTRELRVRDLLTHNAGLGNADFLWYGKDVSLADVLDRIRFAEAAYSFRSSFIYQNIMYAAAGALIEEVSGVPWDRFVEQRMFRPLGMNGTIAMIATLEQQPDFARPHDRVDGELQVIDNASVDPIAAAGSVWSSVDDMSKWTRFLLAGGVTPGGDRLLTEETLEELFRPQAMVTDAAFYPTARLTRPKWKTYGLAWFQHDYQGRAVDFHTGSIDGMVAIHGLIRSEGLGVYVLANRDHAEVRHALMYRVFDAFGDGTDRDWSTELLELYRGLETEAEAAWTKVESERVQGTASSLDPEDYAGTYKDRLNGIVTVEPADGGDLRVVHGPGLQGTAAHWNYDTFLIHWDAAWRGRAMVRFTIGAGGIAESLELDGRAFARVPE